jgi:penicillin amidase/acyl-homoserine-lactone acylase
MTNRAWRAMETYGADSQITPEKFRAYKFDLDYSVHSDLVQLVDQVVAMNLAGEKDGGDLGQAQELLKRWDHRTNVANRCAALAVLMGEPVLRARIEIKGKPQPPPQSLILTKLREAVKTLQTRFGRLNPEWGQVNRLRRGKVDLAVDGGPDIYRAVYGVPRPDGTLTAAGGDTFIMFVTWDRKGTLTSESIHQFGSATLDQNSPHYADQTPLFVAMKTKPVLFTQTQLGGHIETDYRPGEAGAVVAEKR